MAGNFAGDSSSTPVRRYAGVNLYVKNLEKTVDDQQLWRLFSNYGTILSCKVALNEDGTSKCFGFVCYTNDIEASLAFAELNGRVIGTKPLYVNIFESKEERHKSKLKKAVEHFPSSENSPLTTLAVGRGRGRIPQLQFGNDKPMAVRAPYSPPGHVMKPQSSGLQLGPGFVTSQVLDAFTRPDQVMKPCGRADLSEPQLGIGLGNFEDAFSAFSPPDHKIPLGEGRPSFNSRYATIEYVNPFNIKFSPRDNPGAEGPMLPVDQ